MSNLQSVLSARNPPPPEDAGAETPIPEAAVADAGSSDDAPAKPVVLLACTGGIQSPGLTELVDALIKGGRCDAHVCARESAKTVCGHSITIRETLSTTSVHFTGAKAFEISGTPPLSCRRRPPLAAPTPAARQPTPMPAYLPSGRPDPRPRRPPLHTPRCSAMPYCGNWNICTNSWVMACASDLDILVHRQAGPEWLVLQ